MKLSIDSFAKIKKANIIVDGITVIAGENNTGKSRNDTDPNTTAATGSGYDIANVDNTVKPKKERTTRGKKTAARIMPSLEQNQNKITERTVRRVY